MVGRLERKWGKKGLKGKKKGGNARKEGKKEMMSENLRYKKGGRGSRI